MELDKAIEIQNDLLTEKSVGIPDDLRLAMNLGIEALKRVRDSQEKGRNLDYQLLPGETPPDPLHALGFNTGDDESPQRRPK